MLKYFIYCRKSSEDEDRQLLSNDAQISELNAIALRDGLTVVRCFTESKSAREPGREVFNEMIRRIEQGEANAVLAWKLDRLARNFDDGGKIIGLLQRGVIQEIHTFEKKYLPNDNVLTIAVELGFANQYVRDLSVNIKRGIREKIRRGIFNGKAPLGYYNEPRLRTIEPHPKLFKKVKRILEKFATGKFNLTAIQRELNAAKIVGTRTGKPVSLSSVDEVLTNPFYYGVFVHKGETHQGTHFPMITKKTFDEIQAARIAVGRPRKRQGDKGFIFLNFANCAACGYGITAERHTKRSGLRFDYYRCTHKGKKQRCENRSFIREETLAGEVKKNVQSVSLPDEWHEKFRARIETWEATSSNEKQSRIDQLKSELATVKTKIERLNTGFADGSLDIQEFKELKNPLVPEKTGLEQQIVALETSKVSRLEPLRTFLFEANQGSQWVKNENWLEMKSFLQKVGSNRLLRAQTLTISFKKPSSLLAETVLSVQRTNDVSLQSSVWWSRQGSNLRPSHCERDALPTELRPHPPINERVNYRQFHAQGKRIFYFTRAAKAKPTDTSPAADAAPSPSSSARTSARS